MKKNTLFQGFIFALIVLGTVLLATSAIMLFTHITYSIIALLVGIIDYFLAVIIINLYGEK